MPIPTTPPPIKDAKRVNFQAPEKMVLPNGVPVYVLDGAPEPIVRLEAVFPAGRRHEKGRGISAAAARLMTEGAGAFDGDAIAETVERYGGSLRVRGGFDYITLHYQGLNRHLSKVLPLFHALLEDASYTEKATVNYVRSNRQKLKIREEKVDYLADVGMRETFFGAEHPYGYRMTQDAFAGLEPDQLREHHRRTIAKSQPFLVVAGAIDKDVKQFLTEAFGRSERGLLAEPVSPDYPPTGADIIHLPKAGAVQSAIRFAKPVVPKTDPDYYRFFVLNTVLGGYFGSRLMSNIREDKGYTYGIYSGMTHFADGRFFYISSEVGAPVCEAAVQEVRAEMARLRNEAIPDAELDIVRHYLVGSILGSVDGPFKTADTVRGILQSGLPMDHVQKLVDTIQRVNAVELQALAQRYLAEDDLLEYIVGWPETAEAHQATEPGPAPGVQPGDVPAPQ